MFSFSKTIEDVRPVTCFTLSEALRQVKKQQYESEISDWSPT